MKELLNYTKNNPSALFSKMKTDLGITGYEELQECWYDYCYLDYLLPEDLQDETIYLENFVFRPYDERTTRFVAIGELSKEHDLSSEENFYSDFKKWLEGLS